MPARDPEEVGIARIIYVMVGGGGRRARPLLWRRMGGCVEKMVYIEYMGVTESIVLMKRSMCYELGGCEPRQPAISPAFAHLCCIIVLPASARHAAS